MPRRFLAGLLLSAASLAAHAQNALPSQVSQALAAVKIPAANVAAVVQEVGVHHEIIRANATAPMNPASVMKLVTTYAALELLGPAYRWSTQAYVTGSLQDGVLEGDLVLRGGGDPKLDLEGFGLVTAEALACGTPVLASRAGANAEVVSPLDERLLFDAGSVDALAAKLADVLARRLPLPSREACAAHARTHFRWERPADAFERAHAEFALPGGGR